MKEVITMRKNLKAYRSYVCPNCFHQLNKCTCKIFPPYSLLFIDELIQEHIRILNEKGYRTNGCCESHYNGVCICIYISFGRDSFDSVPEGFYFNKRRQMIIHDYKAYKNYTRDQFEKEKMVYLAVLLDWVKSLPDINKPKEENINGWNSR